MKEIRTYSPDKELVEEKREHIVKCARDIFAKNGYHKTTLREIMKACDMGAGVLYHYIGTKEDILYLVMVSSVENTKKTVDEVLKRCETLKAKEKLIELIRVLVQISEDGQDNMIMENRELKNLNRGARQVLLDGYMSHNSTIEKVLIQGVKTGEFMIEDTFLVAHQLTVTTNAWALQRWYLRNRYTQEQFTNFVINDIMQAILKK